MILFRIVFAVTAILLSRDAFAEPGMWIGTAHFALGRQQTALIWE
jgi:hypothetical protein